MATSQYFNSIDEAREYLENKKQIQKDFIADKSVSGAYFNGARLVFSRSNDKTAYSLTDTAFSQLMDRCKIPERYGLDLMKTNQGLLSKNVNERFPSDNLLYRTEGESIRAVLTPVYKPINHLEVLNGLETFINRDSLILSKLYITSDFMRWTVVPVRELGEGDSRIKVGWDGANGETGLTAIARSLYVLMLVCSNGALAMRKLTSYRSTHVKDRDRVLNDYWNMSSDYSVNMLTLIQQASATKLDGRLRDVVSKVMSKYISEKENLEQFLDIERRTGRLNISRMDLINNVTDFAKQLNEQDRREMEVFAGAQL